MNYSDPKKFGYYTVGNRLVFSKIEALEFSNRLNQPINYHFNDEVFSSCDWSTEPTDSLENLYINRAKQIREQYDYVVLFYSGGADSHNMLEAFVHAKVEPDEIVGFHSYSADKDYKSAFNREVFETTVPYVKLLKQQQKLSDRVLHRLLDMSDVIFQFNKEINWLEFPYYFNSNVSINNVARGYFRKYVNDWRKIIDSGKKLCFVWGQEKPRVDQVHDKFYLKFLDLFDNCVSVINQQTIHEGYFDEMFYTTPDFPSITLKQAHVVKNFLNTVKLPHPYVTKRHTGLGHVMLKVNNINTSHWLSQDGLSYLIYPWFNDQQYYESKPKDIITSKRDRWFWSDIDLSKNFTTAVDGIHTKFQDQWAHFNPAYRWTHAFSTKLYQIGQ